MRHLPRVAVGTIQSSADPQPLLWGLLDALHSLGQEVVHFHSASSLAPHDAIRSLTGTGSRHLDSWAMSRSGCLRLMKRAAGGADLAIVEGSFTGLSSDDCLVESPGSRLDLLGEWLDLPQIAVVDLPTLAACRMPPRPARLDALLLDGASDARQAAYWQTNFEALWGVPVLGWLDRADSLRSLCRTLPAGRDPSPELCAALGRRVLANLRLDKLLALADRPLPDLPADDLEFELEHGPLRIAVAYDEDFCGYFPDTLDLLEEAGAQLCDFSPLRSGALPDDTDVVYIGCGHPERQADVLAGNHCLRHALREFASRGGRIYGEGSGLAYLCREIVVEGGRRVPMTGLLPVIARLTTPAAPQPVEVTFGVESWLVEQGTAIRGYRHSGWQIEPRGSMVNYAQAPAQRLDILGRGNVIGSRLMVNLAANEHLLRRFLSPCVPVAAALRRDF